MFKSQPRIRKLHGHELKRYVIWHTKLFFFVVQWTKKIFAPIIFQVYGHYRLQGQQSFNSAIGSKLSCYDGFTGAFLYSIRIICVIRFTCVTSAFLEPAAPLSLNLFIPEEWPENYNFRCFHIFVIRHFPLFCVFSGLWFKLFTWCCCWGVAKVTNGVIRETTAAVHQSWQREHRCRQYKTKHSYQLNREKENWWEGVVRPFVF